VQVRWFVPWCVGAALLVGACGEASTGTNSSVLNLDGSNYATLPPAQSTTSTTTTLPSGPVAGEQEYVVQAGDFPPLRSSRSGELRQPPLPTRMRFDGDIDVIGRGRALEQILLAWDAARERSSPVVLVSGEPGVGKTRLVAEAATRLHAGGAPVLYGRCDPFGGSPHQPFAQALSTLADGLDRQTVRTVLAPHSGDLVRLVPRLEQLVPGLAAPIDGEASGNRYRLFNAVSASLAALADLTSGVVLVIDDFQWADPSTIALLEHLAVAAAPPGVMVIVIYRHTDVARHAPSELALGELRRRGGATVVHLAGLTLEEVEAYVSAAAGHELGDLAEVVTELYARTEGNPFFIRELIRHLVDTQAASFDGRRWTVGSISEAGIPQGVRDLVRQRLATLPEPTNDLLVAAALFGEEFDIRLVAHACGVDVAATLAALEPAIEAGLVAEASPGCYSFVHLLMRMTIYDDLPATRRVRGHVAAARAIEALGTGERHWPDLAHHWGEAAVAGHVEEAVASALQAGERAIAATAHDAAVEYLRAAHTYFGDRARIGDVEGMEVQLRLAEALNMTGRLDDAEAEFAQAADQARRAGRADLFARAALGLGGDLPLTPPVNERAIALIEQALARHPEPSSTRALLLGRLAERRHRIDPACARNELVEEALALARGMDDDRLLATVMLSRLRTMQGPAAMAETFAITTEVDRLAARLPDDSLAVRSAQLRMVACFVLGDLSGAAQAARVTSVLAQRLRQPECERLPLMWDAFRAMYEGRFDAGSAIVDELNAMLSGGRHSQTAPMVGALLMPRLLFEGQTEMAYDVVRDMDISYREALLAWFAAESGALDRAWHHLERLGPVAQIESDQSWSWWQGMVATATAASLCGHTAILADVRDALAPWADQHATAGLVTYLGSGHHHLGVVEGHLGHLDAAVRELDLAVIAHESLGARPWVALTQVELARVLDQRAQPGDAARAASVRAAALDTASVLGLQNVLARA